MSIHKDNGYENDKSILHMRKYTTVMYINDEFEGEEYVATNKGEVYQVMNTIVEIVKNYMKEHAKVNVYEFNAVGRDNEDDSVENGRMVLYRRFLPKIFEKGWNFKIEGNFALVTKA
jgi:hypothetical protein